MVMMFKPKPALIISTVLSLPVPNTDRDGDGWKKELSGKIVTKKVLRILVDTQCIMYWTVAPMAFGPVDIGSIKAQEATRVAGSIKKSGFTCSLF